MKKPHTGGFLKSPFNMYEGSSTDSPAAANKRQNRKARRAATQVVLKGKSPSAVSRLYSVSGESREKGGGTTQRLCLPSPCFSFFSLDTTTQQPGGV